MKKSQDSRLQNVEFHYNGLQNEKGLDLLRECVKSIMDEQIAEREKRKLENQTAEA